MLIDLGDSLDWLVYSGSCVLDGFGSYCGLLPLGGLNMLWFVDDLVV